MITSRTSGRKIRVPNKHKSGDFVTDGSEKTEGHVANHDVCDSCGIGGSLLCCDGCPSSFHCECLDPPIGEDELAEGEWYCRKCMSEKAATPTPNPATSAILRPIFDHLSRSNPKEFRLPPSMKRNTESSKIAELQKLEFKQFLTRPIENLSLRYTPVSESRPKKRTRKDLDRCAFCHLTEDLKVCSLCHKQYHAKCLKVITPNITFPLPKGWSCPDHDPAKKPRRLLALQDSVSNIENVSAPNSSPIQNTLSPPSTLPSSARALRPHLTFHSPLKLSKIPDEIQKTLPVVYPENSQGSFIRRRYNESNIEIFDGEGKDAENLNSKYKLYLETMNQKFSLENVRKSVQSMLREDIGMFVGNDTAALFDNEPDSVMFTIQLAREVLNSLGQDFVQYLALKQLVHQFMPAISNAEPKSLESSTNDLMMTRSTNVNPSYQGYGEDGKFNKKRKQNESHYSSRFNPSVPPSKKPRTDSATNSPTDPKSKSSSRMELDLSTNPLRTSQPIIKKKPLIIVQHRLEIPKIKGAPLYHFIIKGMDSADYVIREEQIPAGVEFVIGRDEGSHIDISTVRTVSHKHCAIQFSPELNSFEIVGWGKNGTKLNGESIGKPGEPKTKPIKDGDIIEISNFKFQFIVPTPTTTAK
eukprot:TRINITY_DN6538_c0_g1_i1.p1 TRINITY_DN6538_c0_g1~~TRINITY_DN6538_c0_g1_i1.p1  ORF type:complete len:641 (-),score=103.10 TRINITY_DN6538_c0_g1_i1:60-1982(-)